METLDSALDYLQKYLDGRNSISFRFACRWDGKYRIDPLGGVWLKEGHFQVVPVPNELSQTEITKWVDAARHILATHRLTRGAFPEELADLVHKRQAGV